jgi:hypothetical protein
MLWAIGCGGKPNTGALRDNHMQSHRRYLDERNDVLLLAGATLADDGEQATGSLFVIAACSSSMYSAGFVPLNYLIGLIAFAGFKKFWQVSVQLIVVWQRYTSYDSFSASHRLPVRSLCE